MTYKILAIAIAGLYTLTACMTNPSEHATDDMSPKAVARGTLRATATVEAVDKDNRILTLRTPSGEIRTIRIDSVVKNFDRIKRGDHIVIEYLEEVTVYLETQGTATKDERVNASASADDNGPSGVIVETLQRRATVQDVDYTTRTLTLLAPDGRRRTVRISSHLGPIDKINRGDRIIVRYTKIIAVGVTQAAR
jgi:hypothetical protein